MTKRSNAARERPDDRTTTTASGGDRKKRPAAGSTTTVTHSGQDERLHFLSVMHCLERLETLTIADPIRAQERIAHVAESVGVGVGVVVVVAARRWLLTAE